MAPAGGEPPLLHPLARRQALGPCNQGKVDFSLLNTHGRLAEHFLGGGPAHVRKVTTPIGQTQALGEAARRVVVGPADTVNNVHVVNAVNDAGAAAIPCGGLGHLSPQFEGLGRIALLRTKSALGNANQTGRTRIDQRPLQRGGRFSANALGPSFASSLWKTRLLSSASTA